ncbi:hypothetical protein BJX70DRAFT_250349 [Aspergillus crustosus]
MIVPDDVSIDSEVNRLLAMNRESLVSTISRCFGVANQVLLGQPSFDTMPVSRLIEYLPKIQASDNYGIYIILADNIDASAMYIGYSMHLSTRMSNHLLHIRKKDSTWRYRRLRQFQESEIFFRRLASFPSECINAVFMFFVESVGMILFDTLSGLLSNELSVFKSHSSYNEIRALQIGLKLRRPVIIRCNLTLSLNPKYNTLILTSPKPSACEVCHLNRKAITPCPIKKLWSCNNCRIASRIQILPDDHEYFSHDCDWCGDAFKRNTPFFPIRREDKIYCFRCYSNVFDSGHFNITRTKINLVCECPSCDTIVAGPDAKHDQPDNRSWRIARNRLLCSKCGTWYSVTSQEEIDKGKIHRHDYGQCECEGCKQYIGNATGPQFRLKAAEDGRRLCYFCYENRLEPHRHPIGCALCGGAERVNTHTELGKVCNPCWQVRYRLQGGPKRT